MNISTDDMKSCIQEWFAQAFTFENLKEIYIAVRCEADVQFEFMANEIAKERAQQGLYNNETI